MEKDTRISDFTGWWHDEYKRVKGVYPTWNKGKEQAAIKKAISYMDANFKENAYEMLLKAAKAFLNESTKFNDERAHDVMDLCSKPHKYVQLAQKEEATEVTRKRNEELLKKKEVTFNKDVKKPLDEFDRQGWIDRMAANPKTFIHGFKLIAPYMKRAEPKLYANIRAEILDFYGATQATKLWKEFDSI